MEHVLQFAVQSVRGDRADLVEARNPTIEKALEVVKQTSGPFSFGFSGVSGSSLGFLHPDLAPSVCVHELPREDIARPPGIPGITRQLRAGAAHLAGLIGRKV